MGAHKLEKRTIRHLASDHIKDFVGGAKKVIHTISEEAKKYATPILPHAKSQVICVASGKGGTGKTTVTSNLAYALSKYDLKILLVDGDLGLSNLHLQMGMRPKADISDVLNGSKSLNEIIIKGHGDIHLVPGGTGISELTAMKDSELRHMAKAIGALEKDWDLILIDLSAGITPQVMRFLNPAHEIVMVINPEVTSLMDAYALLKSYDKIYRDHKISVKFVVNRVKDEDDAINAYRRLGRVVKKHLNGIKMSMWAYIPDDKFVSEAIFSKRPVAMLHPRAFVTKCFEDLADQVINSHVSFRETQESESKLTSYFAQLEQQSYE